MMKTITFEQCMEFNPCYGEKRIRKIADTYPDRTEWTALDILRLDEVPDNDKLWLVLREELVDAPTVHEFACRCAERALSRVANPDPRSVKAIEAKRAWLRGDITGEELDAACTAALDVACTAARAAAWAAARDAARDAAWAAARDAACTAALDAAWAATRAAAWDAERQWQVDELVRMLEGEKDEN